MYRHCLSRSLLLLTGLVVASYAAGISNANDYGIIDLRDLLLEPADAAAAGGSGDSPYGDAFASMIMPAIQDEFLSPQAFNERIVGVITAQQSGTSGVLDLLINTNTSSSGDISGSSSSSSKNFTIDNEWINAEFNLLKLQLQSLDSVSELVSFQPINRNVLNNRIQARSIQLSFDSSFLGDGLDILVALPSSSLEFNMLAGVQNVLNYFPLRDVANIYCWIAAAATTNEFGVQDISVTLPSIIVQSRRLPFLQSAFQSIDFSTFTRRRIERLLEETMTGYWQSSFDLTNLLEQAPQLCPHRLQYNATQTAISNFQQLESLEFSKYNTETLLGTTIVSLQAVLIVMAIEYYHDFDYENAEAGIVPNDTAVELVDWMNLDVSVGPWAELCLRELRKYLNSTDTFLQLIQSSDILNEDGIFVVPLEGNEFQGFSLRYLRIYGIDTVTFRDEILMPTTPTTLATTLHFDRIQVEFDLDTRLSDDTVEKTTMIYTWPDVEMRLDLHIEMERTFLWELQLSSISIVENILPCILQGLQSFQISQMAVTTKELEPPVISSFLEPDFQNAVDQMSSQLFAMHKNKMLLAQTNMFNTTVRDIISSYATRRLSEIDACPTATAVKVNPSGLVDFRDLLLNIDDSKQLGGAGDGKYGNLFRTIYNSITEIGNSLNSVLGEATEKESGTSGALELPGLLTDRSAIVKLSGLEATLGIQVSDASVKNLDSIGDPFEILRPVNEQPTGLTSTFSIGTDGRSLQMAATVGLSIKNDDTLQISNLLKISMEVDTLSVFSTILLAIDSSSLFQFQLRDSLNVFCWLATLPPKSDTLNNGAASYALGISESSLSLRNFSLDIECIECTSPTFDAFLTSLYSPMSDDEPGALIRNVAGKIAGSDLISEFVDTVVRESASACPHRPEYDAEIHSNTSVSEYLEASASALTVVQEVFGKPEGSKYFTMANAVVAGLLLTIAFLLRWWKFNEDRELVHSLSLEGQQRLDAQRSHAEGRLAYLNQNSTSLFKSEHLSWYVRVGVPCYLAINFGLFVGGHLGVLSIVGIEGTLAGEPIVIDNFMKFSFIASSRRTYANGGTDMAILMWVFTGVWPYIKLALSLGTWMCPPRLLPVQRRERILLWVDSLVRMSVIDLFTALIGIATILIFIGGREKDNSEEEREYSMKLIVTPNAGVYYLVIAQRMSRVSSQYLLECHERVVNMAGRSNANVDDLDLSQSSGSSRCNRSTRSFDASMSSSDRGSDHFDDSLSENSSILDDSSSASDESRATTLFQMIQRQRYNWGTVGVAFGSVTILCILIIGIVLAPSVSFDVSEVWSLTLDSGVTFREAVSNYGVFFLVSGVLLKARFMLRTTSDFIGLGLLFTVAITGVSVPVIVRVWEFFKKRAQTSDEFSVSRLERWLPWNRRDVDDDSESDQGEGVASYIEFNKFKHIEIFVIAGTIGVWQLGSVASYAVHMYCVVLIRLYAILTSIGLVAETDANCYREQASDPGFLLVIFGAFFGLAYAFTLGARAQVAKNIKDSKATSDAIYHDIGDSDYEDDSFHKEKRQHLDAEQSSTPHQLKDYFNDSVVDCKSK